MPKNTFAQNQTQTQMLTQTLSPHQVMVVRLLELTNIELEDKVRSELMENPALEAVDSDVSPSAATMSGDDDYGLMPANSADDYRSEDDVPDYNGWEYHSRGEVAEEIPVSADVSFGETLLEQLAELSLNEQQRTIGEYLIGSLEEDGLLHKPLTEIEDELMVYYGIYVECAEIERILSRIQGFDPPGIGARTLQECLLLQLTREEESGVALPSTFALQRRILTECYDDFSKKRWNLLPDKLGVSEVLCREALGEIARLNPRPGASLAESLSVSRQQIIPDFTVDIHDDVITVSLDNLFVPELRVSNEYQQMLDEQLLSALPEHRAAAQFLKQKIDAAKGFITAVKQREKTLMDTMNVIAAEQADFLLSGGDEAQLKPMILEDVAKATGYDISTVSRVSNSKYVQLPWGIFPLKYFFNDAVTMNDGGERSVRELYRCLQELVDAEDKSNPLTDTELMDKLKEQGFTMARRTVAKYREQLHIPVARLRKE